MMGQNRKHAAWRVDTEFAKNTPFRKMTPDFGQPKVKELSAADNDYAERVKANKARAAKDRQDQATLERVARERRIAKANAGVIKRNAEIFNRTHHQLCEQHWRESAKRAMARHAMGGYTRHVQIKMATPKWMNKDAMLLIYQEAARLTAETGVPHHVDHIVPIKAKLVCGLHCEANLRVITKTENLKKHNSYWPDMPKIYFENGIFVV